MENTNNLKFGYAVKVVRPGCLEGLTGQIKKVTGRRVFVSVAGRKSYLYLKLHEVKRIAPKRSRSVARSA